jgi:hypothetical protein
MLLLAGRHSTRSPEWRGSGAEVAGITDTCHVSGEQQRYVRAAHGPAGVSWERCRDRRTDADRPRSYRNGRKEHRDRQSDASLAGNHTRRVGCSFLRAERSVGISSHARRGSIFGERITPRRGRVVSPTTGQMSIHSSRCTT